MFDWLLTDGGLWALFSTGFLSATLLPGGSEALLIALLSQQTFSPLILILVATLGNTLGGQTNYWLGRLIPNKEQFQDQNSSNSSKKSKLSKKSLQWLHKYGYWALLLSWLPIIGDPLCVAAGWLRMNHWLVLLLIFIGKLLRYSFIGLIILGIL
ncbi:DedA family protein [Vibrio sp. SS-MA-C1-2]|uniref:YqaA family protein n=1 Tax=Vibrio sp. SS-MA-C1-2 TaxID=2908646 RepID=UPI001F464F90|nr:YqaA family protein [Vibrio sp. SS-MA-C1-2]UJF19007.1 DedA family protein [Vibrio sp. SS-MA-C1-2]